MHLLVSLIIMLVLLIAAKGFVKIGTVICMALGGPIIDLWELLLDPVLGSLPLAGRIALLVAGCVILAFGMTVVISSDLGAGPNDLVAVSISEIFKKPFGVVRVCSRRGLRPRGLAAGRRARRGHGGLRLPRGADGAVVLPAEPQALRLGARARGCRGGKRQVSRNSQVIP